ncbi:hypothetical protein PQX77_008080, partial [Marasmius sp. AFHP31]
MIQCSGDITFVGNQQFHNIAGNVTNVHQNCCRRCETEEDRILPRQTQFQEFHEGHILLEGPVWSQMSYIDVLGSTNPFRKPVKTKVKVVKKLQTARIYPNYECTVTLVKIEPVAKNDRAAARLLWKECYQAYSSYRSPWLAQMLGLVKSKMPTFVLHQELVNGLDFTLRYPHYGIVYSYLFYIFDNAIEALCADEVLTVPVTRRWADWMFDPKTKSWYYDVASASIGRLDESFSYNPTPFPQGVRPQLNANDIATYFEKSFGDVLYLYASLGVTRQRALSDYSSNGVLTFGALVKYGGVIVAYFASTPYPEWHFESQSRNIKASYCTKVPSRVDFEIHNTHNTRLNLRFSLRLPVEERNRLRVAYLSQHTSNANLSTYFIDEIGFSLVGDLYRTSTNTSKPVYLFVPTLQVEYINGMHCIRYPLPDSLFYWATDPEGKHLIPEEQWERYEIPELKVRTWIGSYWDYYEYNSVKDHLLRKNYGSDGKQYARDHGCPELIP